MWRVLLLLCLCCTCASADYWTERQKLIRDEYGRRLGSKIKLSQKEQLVNKILMKYKWNELNNGFTNPEGFLAGQHFFNARPGIQNSKVFSLIKKMPKGGALHIHDTSLANVKYVVYNITYRDNLYLCQNGSENIQLKFMDPAPEDACWKSVKLLRQEARHVEDFDEWLEKQFTMVVENPLDIYIDNNVAWKYFHRIFDVLTPMLCYRPVFLDYFYQALEDFYNDNVNFVEVRGTLPTIYELNGVTYDRVELMGMLKERADEFMRTHPDFLGIKYIFCPSRHINNSTLMEDLEVFKKMKQLYPDFVVGFDIAGQEDLGTPLVDFVDQLRQVDDTVKFFFHAGETNWNGLSTDMNVIDAVLLNTTRIGHGFALIKHPKIMEEVKSRGIGIEVNPISNQVLALVKDLRNHPASVLFTDDYPVVISSDDPAFWDSTGLSYDFYEAFMAIASASSDLRTLKQLILNSFYYSAWPEDQKNKAISQWHQSWDKYMDYIIAKKYAVPHVLFS